MNVSVKRKSNKNNQLHGKVTRKEKMQSETSTKDSAVKFWQIHSAERPSLLSVPSIILK